MYLELFLASTLLCVGNIVFGRFEAETARVRRVAKVVVFLAATAAISRTWGREAALAWVVGGMALGVGVHAWWTRRHGIGFLDPEPWDRYAALRGWTR
jgi:hypothetical protein